MTNLIKRIPTPIEVALVLYFAFGKYIYWSTLAVFNSVHQEKQVVQVLDNAEFLTITVYQLVALLVLLPFLKIRGWSFSDYGLRMRWSDLLWGAGFVFILNAWWYLFSPLFFSFLHIPTDIFAENTATIIPVTIFSVVNSFYEEIFVCAYLIVVISRRFSIQVAINVSILIRLSYHLYQGIPGLIFIIPMGIIFAYWFARTKRLWPLIYAHIIFDIYPILIRGALSE